MQTTAPSSMIPCVKSDGEAWETRRRDDSQHHDPNDFCDFTWYTERRRDSTRITFPSTAGSGLLKAMERIAPAVYSPMPGTFSSSSFVSGIVPLHFSTMYWR